MGVQNQIPISITFVHIKIFKDRNPTPHTHNLDSNILNILIKNYRNIII